MATPNVDKGTGGPRRRKPGTGFPLFRTWLDAVRWVMQRTREQTASENLLMLVVNDQPSLIELEVEDFKRSFVERAIRAARSEQREPMRVAINSKEHAISHGSIRVLDVELLNMPIPYGAKLREATRPMLLRATAQFYQSSRTMWIEARFWELIAAKLPNDSTQVGDVLAEKDVLVIFDEAKADYK